MPTSSKEAIKNEPDNPVTNIWIAFLLNLAFATTELVGGLLTGSVAILADAIHDFGDSLTLGLSLILERLAKRKRTSQYTYGFKRLSLLSSLIAGTVLCVGSGIVLYEAVPRFWQSYIAPNGPWMVGLAVFGICVNGFAALRLRQGKTRNETILSWHLLEDVLGWIAVLIGGILITLTGWTWVDPLLACLVALFVLYNVVRNLWKTTEIFLQRTPEEFNEMIFREQVKHVRGVVDLHDIHAWSLDGETNVLSLHVEVNPKFNFESDLEDIKQKIRAIAAAMGKFHTTIEVESSRANAASHEKL